MTKSFKQFIAEKEMEKPPVIDYNKSPGKGGPTDMPPGTDYNLHKLQMKHGKGASGPGFPKNPYR